jgi:hypothetical protein
LLQALSNGPRFLRYSWLLLQWRLLLLNYISLINRKNRKNRKTKLESGLGTYEMNHFLRIGNMYNASHCYRIEYSKQFLYLRIVETYKLIS